MNNDQSDQLLDIFARSLDPIERVSALTSLMTIKAIPKRADDPRFAAGLDQWLNLAKSSETEPRTRLLAIAELIRSTQQLKKRQPELIKRAQISSNNELPPISLLEDPEARLNVARACSMTDSPWLQSYRAASIANETAPKPRAEMMEGLVARAGSISEVIELLQPPFEDLLPETDNPAESLAKRLARTLEIFRTTILASLIEAGPNVGKKLDSFIRSTLTATGRPKDELVQMELTREVALTLHDLVRSRFSLATEPQTFLALQYCRTFFSGISWPKEVQRETDLLVQDISEALVMLGRMGISNQELLNRLELTCGLKERARYVASNLADKHVEIDESIRSWLRTGRIVNTISASEVLQETLLDAMDEMLGLALVEARKFKQQSDSEQRLEKSLEIFDPSLVSLFKSFSAHSFSMLNAIEDLARRRELDLLGTLGGEIEFSRKYFDALGVLRGNSGIVRRPAIIKRDSQGVIGAVVKRGLVE